MRARTRIAYVRNRCPINILLAFVIVLLFPLVSLAQSGNNSDAMNHLRAFTLATSEETVLGDKAAMLLGLVETNRSVPTKQVSVALTDDIRFFTVSTEPNSEDITLTIKQDAAVQMIVYLTNSRLLLRAAVVQENGTPHLIFKEEAAGFEALLMFWVGKSKSLQTGHAH